MVSCLLNRFYLEFSSKIIWELTHIFWGLLQTTRHENLQFHDIFVIFYIYMNTWIKFLPSFSLVVFGFFVAKKICKEITLSGRHQKYSAFTISTLCKDCLPCNFPGRSTVVNASHGMFIISVILQQCLLPLVAVAVVGFV